MKKIDLNCDLAEGFDHDEEMMKYISSANIACGFHAGNAQLMKEAVELSLKNSVKIGAHPGLPDKENFGRKKTPLSPNDLFTIVHTQIDALSCIAKSKGAKLYHVKAHGALYHMINEDSELAVAFCQSVKEFDDELIVYGFHNSPLLEICKVHGIQYRKEIFADRTYTSRGYLTPRNETSATIVDKEQALQQIISIIKEQKVITPNGTEILVEGDTVCLHGDHPHAPLFAKFIHDRLIKMAISIG
ncbi:5-oxoprolinase subunit PxpA [Bacillus sp. 2205SS5-2]|uniref:5-oxoprolinase subunit PxpA n=1 Tax=Bacillus sp. 2205SS5-2 TaxID=3109031 RepID=UPI003005F216